MLRRCFRAAGMLLAVANLALAQATPGEPSAPVVQADAPPRESLSPDEAVQAARDAFVQLESTTDDADRQKLLAGIQQDIELIQLESPNHPWLPYLTGRAFILLGRRGDAAEQLLKFVESREGRNEWRAFRSLGNLFVDEYPRLARGHYEKAAALKPDDPAILFGLSMCAARLGQGEDAIRRAREAVAADGGSSLRYVAHLSGVLRAAGQWPEALDAAYRAVRLARESAITRIGDEDTLRALDAQLGSLIECLQGKIADDEKPAVELFLALAAALRERFDVQRKVNLFNVLRVLEAAMKQTDPDAPAAILEQYAVTLAELGRREAALEAFDRLRAVDPHNPAIAEWQARLQDSAPAPSASP